MKTNIRTMKATEHYNQAFNLLEPLTKVLSELLQDQCAHFTFCKEGLVAVFSDGNGLSKSCLSTEDIDKMLASKRQEAFKILEHNVI